jgi:hypothetical protein
MSKITKTRDGLYRLDGGNGAAVSIGDPSGAKVRPRIHAEKWSGSRWGSCWLALAARDVEPDVAAEKVKAIKGKDALEFECVRTHKGGGKTGEVHRIVAGSTEWDIFWPAVRDVPRVEEWHGGKRYYLFPFDRAEAPGVTWYFQPPLTQAELDDGAFRPANVVNSYAIYGSISGNILRRDGTLIEARETGKLAHYYRSRFYVGDAMIWCFDRVGPGVMDVLVPADELDDADQNATALLDPTFGYTSYGASTITLSSMTDQINATPAIPPTSGIATRLHWYFHTSSAATNIRFGLYSDNYQFKPASRLVSGTGTDYNIDTASPSEQYQDIANTNVTKGVPVHLCFHCSTSGRGTAYYDTLGAGLWYKTGVTYASGLPAEWPAETIKWNTVSLFSAWATYTESPYVAPSVGDVEAGVQYGTNGTEFTGTFAVPAVADVKDGVFYGAGGVEFEGTLAGGIWMPMARQVGL